MATGDRYFGFDLIQRRTLQNLLAEAGSGNGLPGETNFSDWMTSQMLLVGSINENGEPVFINLDSVAVGSGAFQSWAATLPGFGPGMVLAVNAAGTGFEWIDPTV